MRFSIRFLLILLSLFPIYLSGQTIVSGSVSGKWTIKGSPYYVSEDVIVEANQKLVIDPGVRVIFCGNTGLTVAGKITAVGEFQRFIYFMAQDPDEGWNGIKLVSSQPVENAIEWSIIQNAKGERGGGLYLEALNARIKHNIIRNCQATVGGGVLINAPKGSRIKFTQNILKNNVALDDGGGLATESRYENYDLAIENCMIINNKALNQGKSLAGAGISIQGPGSPNITNCTIADNEAPENTGGGIAAENNTNVTVLNSIIYGNTGGDIIENPSQEAYVSISYSNVGDKLWDGLGMISENPLFVKPSTGDYGLKRESPCNNVGLQQLKFDLFDVVRAGKTDLGALDEEEMTSFLTYKRGEGYDCNIEIEHHCYNCFDGMEVKWKNGNRYTGEELLCNGAHEIVIKSNLKGWEVHSPIRFKDTKTNIIFAEFDVNESMQCLEGNKFNFTNTSTAGCLNSNFTWDFGDESSSNEFEPEHSYKKPGDYTVTLIVGDLDGMNNFYTKKISVSDIDVNLGSTIKTCQENVTLNLLLSDTLDYLWNTGSIEPKYTVKESGDYWVRVANEICADTAFIKVDILASAKIDLGEDIIAEKGEVITLDATFDQSNYVWSNGKTTPTIEVTETGTYSVKVSNESCAAADTIMVNFNEPEIVIMNDTVKAGDNIVLSNILFQRARYELTNSSFPEINKLVKILEGTPDLVIQLEGHTSNDGGAEENLELSSKRVQAVKDLLIKKGVAEDRIRTKAFGEEQPIVANDTEEGKKLNRRVELRIISF